MNEPIQQATQAAYQGLPNLAVDNLDLSYCRRLSTYREFVRQWKQAYRLVSLVRKADRLYGRMLTSNRATGNVPNAHAVELQKRYLATIDPMLKYRAFLAEACPDVLWWVDANWHKYVRSYVPGCHQLINMAHWMIWLRQEAKKASALAYTTNKEAFLGS